jgi:hypothetical protein
VELARPDGVPVADATFDNLPYACVAASPDEWVWAATEPLTLEVTPP